MRYARQRPQELMRSRPSAKATLRQVDIARECCAPRRNWHPKVRLKGIVENALIFSDD